MVVGSLLEPLRRPPDEPGALLEEGRKGAVAVGDESARVRKSSRAIEGGCGSSRCLQISKGHGFDLESTQLRSFGRLSRLTLAVAMLYVWLVEHGARVIKRGQRRMVDRSDGRDHSVFRLGVQYAG
jgi:hypothetical protein